MRKWIAIWLASLAVVAGLTSVLIRAQVQVPPFLRQGGVVILDNAQAPAPADAGILSGSDLGFRVDRNDKDGNAVGTLMVRIDGKWVKALFGQTFSRLSQ
jgi:hypothetical protein